MSEGSVTVDGFDTEVGESEETQETTETAQEETSEKAPLKSGSTPTDDSGDKPEEEEKEEEPKLTEKGTKLDPNPQSALHQQLANEKKLRTQMEQVLKDPVLLRKYQVEAGWIKPEPEAPAFDPAKLQTAEDVVKALNDMDRKVRETESAHKKEVEALKAQLGQVTEVQRYGRIASNLESDASVLRNKYPELKPGSPTYSPELEKKIGDMYTKLDFDQETGSFRGQVSLKDIGEMVMDAAVAFKKVGSEEAQTIVKDKSLGKVITSSKAAKPTVDNNSDPATEIAQRISNVFKR